MKNRQMGFEIIDEITMADIAFRAYGNNLEELFISGAGAIMHILLESPHEITGDKSLDFQIDEENIEFLYFEFLQKIIYYKDAHLILLLPEKISIEKKPTGYCLLYKGKGEKINKNKHKFKTDIKAVTMHNLKIGKHDEIWIATTVVDV
ncbi:archease [Spirochaetota bacterium]